MHVGEGVGLQCDYLVGYNVYYYGYIIAQSSSRMLNKSRNHMLCIAAVFHVLFCIDEAYAHEHATIVKCHNMYHINDLQIIKNKVLAKHFENCEKSTIK